LPLGGVFRFSLPFRTFRYFFGALQSQRRKRLAKLLTLNPVRPAPGRGFYLLDTGKARRARFSNGTLRRMSQNAGLRVGTVRAFGGLRW